MISFVGDLIVAGLIAVAPAFAVTLVMIKAIGERGPQELALLAAIATWVGSIVLLMSYA